MKNGYLYVVICIVIVVIGTLLILQVMPRSMPTENNSEVTNSTASSNKPHTLVDENKARLLAESSPEVKLALGIGGFHYDGVFYISGYGTNDTLQLLTVNVVFQPDNTTWGPLVVTEDPELTKILKITMQEGEHFAGSGK